MMWQWHKVKEACYIFWMRGRQLSSTYRLTCSKECYFYRFLWLELNFEKEVLWFVVSYVLISNCMLNYVSSKLLSTFLLLFTLVCYQ